MFLRRFQIPHISIRYFANRNRNVYNVSKRRIHATPPPQDDKPIIIYKIIVAYIIFKVNSIYYDSSNSSDSS